MKTLFVLLCALVSASAIDVRFSNYSTQQVSFVLEGTNQVFLTPGQTVSLSSIGQEVDLVASNETVLTVDLALFENTGLLHGWAVAETRVSVDAVQNESGLGVRLVGGWQAALWPYYVGGFAVGMLMLTWLGQITAFKKLITGGDSSD